MRAPLPTQTQKCSGFPTRHRHIEREATQNWPRNLAPYLPDAWHRRHEHPVSGARLHGPPSGLASLLLTVTKNLNSIAFLTFIKHWKQTIFRPLEKSDYTLNKTKILWIWLYFVRNGCLHVSWSTAVRGHPPPLFIRSHRGWIWGISVVGEVVLKGIFRQATGRAMLPSGQENQSRFDRRT